MQLFFPKNSGFSLAGSVSSSIYYMLCLELFSLTSRCVWFTHSDFISLSVNFLSEGEEGLIFSYLAAILIYQKKNVFHSWTSICRGQENQILFFSPMVLLLPCGLTDVNDVWESVTHVQKHMMRNGYLLTMASSVRALGNDPAELFCWHSWKWC